MQKTIERTGANGSFRGIVMIDDLIVSAHYGKLLLFRKEIKNPTLLLSYVEDAELILSKHLETLATQKGSPISDLENQLIARGYEMKS